MIDCRRRLWPVLLCVLLLSACAVAETPTPVAPAPALLDRVPAQPTSAAAGRAPAGSDCLARGAFPPLLPGQRYGVNAFLFGVDQRRVLDLAQTAGFGWLRQQIHWRDVESGPGHYDWGGLDLAVESARAQGLQILLSVVRSPAWASASGTGGLPDDPAAIGPFMRELAARYAGRVAAYEIWNEPNLARENGGRAAAPAHYLAVLQAAYAAVKQADACALVLAAPLAATATDDPAIAADDLRFYRELYALEGGAVLRAADALALHPGGGPHAFDARWPDADPAQSRFYFRHIEQLHRLMEQAGDPRQAWITEVGWPVQTVPGAPPPVSATQQADNLVGALRLTRAEYPWVASVFVWNLNFAVLGPQGDEKSAFGILNPDWSPRPAYLALQAYLGAQAAAEAEAAPLFSDGAPYRQGWQFSIAGKSRTAPARAADGTIYVGSDAGRMYALTPAGGLRWAFDAPGALQSAPALGDDGAIYLGDESGHLTALRSDGSLIWQRDLGGAVRGTPQLDAGALYVATLAGEALRLDAGDGKLIWRVQLGIAAAPVLLARPAAGSPALLYAPTAAGEVLAITTAGVIRWRAHIAERIAAAPVLAATPDGTAQLLIGDAEGYLSSLEPAGGQLRWRRKLVERVESPTLPATSPLIAAPPLAGADGTIYLGGRDGVVTALDPAGQPRWRYISGSDISGSPVAGPDGTLYVGLYDKRLLALGPDGWLRWQVRLNGAVRAAALVGPGGSLYVTSLGGRLYTLKLE
jgi:outer membrane protein assembly factor BamB